MRLHISLLWLRDEAYSGIDIQLMAEQNVGHSSLSAIEITL